MRKIRYQTQAGNMEVEVAEDFVSLIARRKGVQIEAISDDDILGFFNIATSTALDRAAAEYVADNGTNT